MTEKPFQQLDLRAMPCPLNFVKTRLALEKIPLEAVLEVWISAESESVMNIPSSIRAEGHDVLLQEPFTLEGIEALRLWIRRLK